MNYRPAYTLIEILIVLSLLGLAAGLISTSYLNFERKEKVKGAALDMVSNIRLAQNNAHSGSKGFGAGSCTSSEILAGWYVRINKASNSYWIVGDCLTATGPIQTERKFIEQQFSLPNGVSMTNLSPPDEVNILFRPLSENAVFFGPLTDSSTPDFFDPDGFLKNPLPDDTSVSVNLKGKLPYIFEVDILPTGEANEKLTTDH